MASSNFPPQAYTRDVLASAYEWLRNQSPSIRELAQDSDSLVALYMQSRRRGVNNSQHAHSIPAQAIMGSSGAESFKQELKNLSEGLKQFDMPTSMPTATASVPTASASVQTATASVQTATASVQQAPIPAASGLAVLQLDSKSHELIQKVRTSLNLGSETEVLRMMIALGYDRIREILPKSLPP